MGQFNSNCPKCNKDIYWFLEAPSNHRCDCGTFVTKEQIEESWDHNYMVHIASLIVRDGYQNLSAERIGKDYSLRPDFVQRALDYINERDTKTRIAS